MDANGREYLIASNRISFAELNTKSEYVGVLGGGIGFQPVTPKRFCMEVLKR